MSTFNATNVTIFTGSYSQTFSLLTDSYDASGSNATVAALQTAFFINALSTIFAQLDPTVNSGGKALWSPLMTALVSTIQSTSVLAGLEPLFLSLLYALSTTGTSTSTLTSWVQVWKTAAPTAKATTGTADLVFYDLVKGQLYGISPATLDSFYAGTYLSTPAVLPQLIELSATWTISKPFTTTAPSSKFMHRRALLLAEKQSNSLVDRDGPASQEKTFLDGCLFVAAVIATGLAIATPPGAIAAAIALGVASGLTLVGTGVPLLEDLGVMKPLSDATPPSAQGSPGVALASADTSGQQQGAQLNFAIVPPGSVLEGLGDGGDGGNGGNGDGGDGGNGGGGGDGGGSGSGGDGGDGGGNGDGGDGGNGSGDGGSGDGGDGGSGDGGSGDGGSGDGGDGGSGGDGGDGGSGDGGDGGSGGSGDGGSGDGGDGGSGGDGGDGGSGDGGDGGSGNGDGGDGGDGGSGGSGDGGDGGDGGSSGNGDGGDGGSSGNGNGDGGDGGNGGGNGDGGNGDGGNGDGGDGGSGDGGSGDGGDGGDANAKA